MVNSLKGFWSYRDLNLGNALCPKFSVPLAVKLCVGCAYVLEAQKINLLHYHAKFGEVRTLHATGGQKSLMFAFCLSITLTTDKVCEITLPSTCWNTEQIWILLDTGRFVVVHTRSTVAH